MKLLVPFTLILLVGFQHANAQGWRGIVPLKSKRADVEQLLGPPKTLCSCERASRFCQCQYEADEGLVNISYSTSPCAGDPSGWNVAADTVLKVRIRWKEPRPLSELQLDQDHFEKAVEDTPTTYYSSREKGVEYTVAWDRDQRLIATSYIPTRKDLHLRCPCFPTLDESTQRSIAFDEFRFRSVDDTLARLDNYVIALSNPMSGQNDWKGYVIIYKGKRTSAATSRRYREAITQHLFRRRAQSREQIEIVDGGYTEVGSIELFMMTRELSPPEPRATWKPCYRKSR